MHHRSKFSLLTMGPIGKTEIMCNLFYASRFNPSILAYHELNGKCITGMYIIWHHWKYVQSSIKTPQHNHHGDHTQQMHDTLAQLLSLQMQCFYIPVTKGYRISGTFELYLTHCSLPTLTPEQHPPRATKSALVLLNLLKGIHGVAVTNAPAELPLHITTSTSDRTEQLKKLGT